MRSRQTCRIEVWRKSTEGETMLPGFMLIAVGYSQ